MESTIIQNQKRIIQSINAQGNDYIFSHVDMQNLVWQGRLSKVKDPNYLDSRAAFVSLNHLVILYPETFFCNECIPLSEIVEVEEAIEVVSKWNARFLIVNIKRVVMSKKSKFSSTNETLSIRFQQPNSFSKYLQMAIRDSLLRSGYGITLLFDNRDLSSCQADLDMVADCCTVIFNAAKDPLVYRFDSIEKAKKTCTTALKKISQLCKINMKAKSLIWKSQILPVLFDAIVFQFINLDKDKKILVNYISQNEDAELLMLDVQKMVVHLRLLYYALKVLLNMLLFSLTIKGREKQLSSKLNMILMQKMQYCRLCQSLDRRMSRSRFQKRDLL